MNKELIISRFAKASASYSEEATVQRQIAATMTARLGQYVAPEKTRRILEVGCGTGVFSRMLIDQFRPEWMLLNDICPEMYEQVEELTGDSILFEAADAETYPFQGNYDLVASCSAIQWFREPERFFARMSRLLTGEGILAFSTFGKENLREITALTGQGLSYLSLDELKEKLSGSYDLLYAMEETIVQPFNSPREVLYHLKRTGVTGVGRQQWTRSRLEQFNDAYNALYSRNNKVWLTYHPLYVIARKR